MYDPQIIIVRDEDGNVHHSYRWADWVTSGLADGSLTEVGDDEASVPADDHGVDPGPVDGGSADGESEAGDADRHDDEGVSESEAGR